MQYEKSEANHVICTLYMWFKLFGDPYVGRNLDAYLGHAPALREESRGERGEDTSR
jgi:hypothetical protein